MIVFMEDTHLEAYIACAVDIYLLTHFFCREGQRIDFRAAALKKNKGCLLRAALV
jgi:hypothetical protein